VTSRRQTLNGLSHPGAPKALFLIGTLRKSFGSSKKKKEEEEEKRKNQALAISFFLHCY